MQWIVTYVRIRSYLISVLRYKFFILDTCYPDIIYVSQNVSIPGYFPKSKGVREQQRLGKTITMFRPCIIFLSRSVLRTAIILAFYGRGSIGLVLVNHYKCIFVHHILKVILLKARRDTLCLNSHREHWLLYRPQAFLCPTLIVHFISRIKQRPASWKTI
jgi:hypothetical protein